MAPEQHGASAGLSVEVFEVEAEAPGLRCCAFLRSPAGLPAANLAYFQSGTGIYTTAHGDLDGLGRSAARSGRFAVLSVDKPGITVASDGRVVVDRGVFALHTMADLVACGRRALDVALARPGIDGQASVLVHGHSEGAQVWARILDVSAARGAADALLDRVRLSVLSGLPMEPVVSGAERQLGVFMPFEIEAFRRALLARDDDYLLLLGMPWRYFEHPTAREGMAAVLSRVAEKRPGLRLDLFHGERDRNAPIAPVRALVEAQRLARAERRPALDARLRAYPGATHQLDARLDTDLDALVASLPARR